MKKVYGFSLDIFDQLRIPPMMFFAGDTACGFLIRVKERGSDVDVTNLTGKLTCRMPSGILSTGDCDIVDGRFSFLLKSTELTEVGRVKAELQLYQNGDRLTMIPFAFRVIEPIFTGDPVTSEAQKRLFDELIEDMAEIKKVVPPGGVVGQILTKTAEGSAWTSVDILSGKSAYEIWLEEGNVGTVEVFLKSLKGKDGTQGPKGDKGEDGAQGLRGIQGPKGDIGLIGSKGEVGSAGTDGKSAFEIWRGLEGNAGKTKQDFFESLQGHLTDEQITQLNTSVKNMGGVQQIKYENGKLLVFDGENWNAVEGGGGVKFGDLEYLFIGGIINGGVGVIGLGNSIKINCGWGDFTNG